MRFLPPFERLFLFLDPPTSTLFQPVPPSVGCPFGAPGRYVDEEGLQNLIRMVPPKPLDVAKTIPTTKEEVPVFSSTALSVFMIAETLKEVGEARFQALEKGRNECIAIEGNVAVYTSDGHFLLGHFANPLGVAMGNNEVVAEVIKQTGLKLKRTAEVCCPSFSSTPFLPSSSAFLRCRKEVD